MGQAARMDRTAAVLSTSIARWATREMNDESRYRNCSLVVLATLQKPQVCYKQCQSDKWNDKRR